MEAHRPALYSSAPARRACGAPAMNRRTDTHSWPRLSPRLSCGSSSRRGSVFPDDYSTLVFDTHGKLLRATLAKDGQYRFPIESQELPEKYVTAVIASEDKRFFSHPGVDPLALAGAAVTNVESGERIRGGSTITMQVARLAEPKKRTYFAKLAESSTALKLSLHSSKKEVLGLYAVARSHGRKHRRR